ncbi:hypothetical protein AB0J40_28860 [Amycolatopsis sp. NPDC049691]|uniref:hypothetical protein n=1 Tax=Amycolatopsis sp. NPDC049691 TaxID=3155155 RepID=UPI00341FE3E7
MNRMNQRLFDGQVAIVTAAAWGGSTLDHLLDQGADRLVAGHREAGVHEGERCRPPDPGGGARHEGHGGGWRVLPEQPGRLA